MKKNQSRKNHTITPLVYGIRTAILTAGITAATSGVVIAGPTGGVITHGSGQISNPNAQSTIINQNSQKLVADWQTFNVRPGETVTFKQPNSLAIALNNILDHNPSQVFGSINANGRVFLVNPNGMYFGPSARVNVGSLVATTLKIDSKKFMSGMNVFGDLKIPAGEGVIVNQGLLQAATGGSISLIAGEVRNEGVIVANLGHVNLASGRKATLDFDGDGLIQFEIQGNIEQNTSQAENAVLNSGEIIANGGQVLLTAAAAKDVFTNVVNNEGIIRANTIENRNGEIFLVGVDAGIVRNSGLLDASGADAGETGGTIKLLGEKVGLFNGAELNVSGNAGGGEVLVGGNFQGNGEERNATVTYIDKNTRINADAIENGDGGKVIVWADNTTRFYGDISARGGNDYGNGGFAEVSGKEYLEYQGKVDLSAQQGQGGTLLLDPKDIVISAAATSGAGATIADNDEFAENQSGTSVINVVELVALINSSGPGSVVELQANNDITVDAQIDSSAGGGGDLTLEAGRSIIINESILLNGNLTLLAHASVADGAIGADRRNNDAVITMDVLKTLDTSTANGNIDISYGDGFDINNKRGVGSMQLGILDAGTGTITLDGQGRSGATNEFGDITVAQVINAGNLNITHSKSTTFTGSVNAATVNSTNTIGAIEFAGDTTISIGLTTAAQSYNVSFTGTTNSVAGDTTFLNTGIITLGNGADTTTFAGGLDTTAASSTSIEGILQTSDAQMDLGIVTLTGDATLDTGTAATSILNVGDVTSAVNASLTLDSGANAAADITVASFAGDGNLTVRDSGGTTFSGNVAAATVDLTDTTGAIVFAGDTTISTGLTTAAQGYDVSFTGTTNSVAGDTTFLNTGIITLGNGADTTTFAGGLDTTAASSTSIEGTVQTSGAQMDLAAVTLTGDATLDTGTAATSIMNVGDVTSAGNALTLDSGANAAADITVASFAGDGNLTVRDSGGTTFSGNVVAATVDLTDTTGAIVFAGDTTISTGLTTAAQGYDVSLTGATNSIAGTTTFNNSGTVTIGDAATDNTSFTAGVTATAPGTVNLAGTISAATGSLSFDSFAAGANNLTLTADEIELTGTNTGTAALVLQTASIAQNIDIAGAGATAALDLTVTEMATLQDGFSSITIGRADGTGDISIGAITFNDPVTIRSPQVGGTISVNGQITGAGDSSVTLDGVTTLNANIVTAGNDINISNSVILGDTLTITLDTTNSGGTLTGAAITIQGGVEGDNTNAALETLELNAGTTGQVNLQGAVGATTPFNITIVQSNGATFTNTVNAETIVITDTVDGQTVAFQDNLIVGTGMTVSNGGADNYNVSITGSTNSIAGNTIFANGGTVTLGDAAGDSTSFTAGVTATAPSSVNVAGTVAAITGTSTISLGDADTNVNVTANSTIGGAATGLIDIGDVILDDGTTLTVGAGNANTINLDAVTGTALSAASNLTINTTGVVTVAEAVGTDIGTVTVTQSGGITFAGTVDAAAIVLTDTTGTIQFSDNLLASDMSAAGNNFNINFHGASTDVQAATAVVLQNTGSVEFGNGGDVLNFENGITHTTGPNTINGTLGKNPIDFGTSTLNLLADRTFEGAVTLGDLILGDGVSVTFGTGGAGDVSVGSISGTDLNASSNIDFNGTGIVNITGDIGTDIGTLTVTNTGGATFVGTVSVANLIITDTANGQTIAFQDNLTVGSGMTVSNLGTDLYNVSITGALNSIAGTTVFNNGGTVTIGDAATDSSSFVAGVTATAPGTVNLAGTISSATGSQSFNSFAAGANNLTLTADEIELTGTNTGTAALVLQTASIAQNIDIAGVGGTAGLDLTVAEMATLQDGFSSITIGRADGTGDVSIGVITFNDPVTIRSPQVGGTISVNGQITGAGDASVTLDGVTTLNANIVTAGNDIILSNNVIVGDTLSVTLDATNAGANATGAAVTLQGRLDGDNATVALETLAINAGTTGQVNLQGAVGVTTPLNLTIVQSNGAIFADTVNASTITISDTENAATVQFQGDVVATSLVTTANGYNVQIDENITVTNDTNFLNTGSLAIGTAADDIATFSGGVDTTAVGGTTTVAGAIRTAGNQADFGAMALVGASTLDTTNNGASSVGAALNIGAVTGAGNNLTLNSGTAGTITASGAIDNVAALDISNSNGAVFQSTIGAVTPGVITISDTENAAIVQFQGDVVATSLVTTANGYNVQIDENITVTNDTNFLNTGNLAIGTAADDIATFSGGLDTTAVSSTSVAGTILTSGNQADFGAMTLAGVSTLDTTNNGASSAGAALNIGAVTGAGNNLTLNSGTAGTITASGAIDNVAALDISNSNGVVFQSTIGAVTPGVITISDTENAATVQFQGDVVATSLITTANGYNVQIDENITVTTDTNFLNTGSLAIGTAADDIATFSGGVDTTAVGGTTTVAGAIRTAGNQADFGAMALVGASTLDTTNNGASSVGAALNIGAVTGAGNNLTLNSGTAGTITASGAIDNVAALDISNSNGAVFQSTIGAVTPGAITISDTENAATVQFQGDVVATSLITTANGYNVQIDENITVTNDTNFLNTGNLAIGTAADDIATFSGGVDTTAVGGTTTVAGAIRTAGNQAGFGAVTLVANSILDTTNAGLITSGADINTGRIDSGGNLLTVNSGLGDINIAQSELTTVNLAGNNVNVTDATAIDIGSASISGGLTVTAAGNITDSGVVDVSGLTTLAAGAGNDITLNTAGNDFSSVGISSGKNVTLVDKNALDFGTSTISGALNASTNGAITDSGNLSVAGLATLGSGGKTIVLGDTTTANFGSIKLTGGNMTVTEASDMLVNEIKSNGIVKLNVGGNDIQVENEATKQIAKEFHFTARNVGTGSKAFRPVGFNGKATIFANSVSNVITLIGDRFVFAGGFTGTFIQAEVQRSNGVERGRLIETEGASAIDAALFDQSVTMFSILDPGLLLPTDQLEEDEDEDEDVAQGWNIEDKLQQNEAGQWELQGSSEMFDFSDKMDDELTLSSNQ